MIRATRALLRGMGTLAWPWRIWIGLLVAVNAVVPLFFLGSREARVVLAAMLIAAVIQLLIVGRSGYVRLLGAGHVVAWVPMLLWLVPRLPGLGSATPFARWLLAVVVVDLASLVIDFVDVARYLAGERRPAPGTAPRQGGDR